MPNFIENMQTLIRIRHKLIKIMDLNLSIFTKKLPPGIISLEKIAKLGVPYYYDFATDSYETSHDYYIRHDKLIFGGVFCLCEKGEKLLILRDIDK